MIEQNVQSWSIKNTRNDPKRRFVRNYGIRAGSESHEVELDVSIEVPP